MGAMVGTAVRCLGDEVGICDCASRGKGATVGTDVAGIRISGDGVGTAGLVVGCGTAMTGIGVEGGNVPNVTQESLSNPSQPPSVDMETSGIVFVTDWDTLENDTDFKQVNRVALPAVVDPSGLRYAYS
jgi:hypothetical protein